MTIKQLVDKLEAYRKKIGDDIPVYVSEDKEDSGDYLVEIGEVHLHLALMNGNTFVSIVEGYK